jgi:hypothetical protein
VVMVAAGIIITGQAVTTGIIITATSKNDINGVVNVVIKHLPFITHLKHSPDCYMLGLFIF